MKIFKNKQKLSKEISNEQKVTFIPTMGGLHSGHIYLVKKAKKLKLKILVSIFVNPKQFNKKKDFLKYPRNLKKDLLILKKLKVDFVFTPKNKDIFSFKPKNKIYLDKFSNDLCGKFRKGHFKGVLDVVNRFLEIIKPKYIILGIKDYQQLILIKKHIIKNKLKVKVISCKTIREQNGVACSSRNQNLNQKKLQIASNVFSYLKVKKRLIKKDLSNFNKIDFKKELLKLHISKIDYIELYNLKTLKLPKNRHEICKLFIAYYLGDVRLIDNF